MRSSPGLRGSALSRLNALVLRMADNEPLIAGSALILRRSTQNSSRALSRLIALLRF
jgi:hypothetical protein